MMNKKFLIIALVVILVLSAGGFAWFKYKGNTVDKLVDSEVSQTVTPEVMEEESKKLQNSLDDLQKVLDEKQKTDSDLDGLGDAQEKQLGTDPTKIDTDGDGLTDYDEVQTYRTDPLKADTDGDSFGDGAELRRDYDPLGPGKLKK